VVGRNNSSPVPGLTWAWDAAYLLTTYLTSLPHSCLLLPSSTPMGGNSPLLPAALRWPRHSGIPMPARGGTTMLPV